MYGKAPSGRTILPPRGQSVIADKPTSHVIICCSACGYWRDIAGGTDHHTEPHGEGRRCVYCMGEVKG